MPWRRRLPPSITPSLAVLSGLLISSFSEMNDVDVDIELADTLELDTGNLLAYDPAPHAHNPKSSKDVDEYVLKHGRTLVQALVSDLFIRPTVPDAAPNGRVVRDVVDKQPHVVPRLGQVQRVQLLEDRDHRPPPAAHTLFARGAHLGKQHDLEIRQTRQAGMTIMTRRGCPAAS